VWAVCSLFHLHNSPLCHIIITLMYLISSSVLQYVHHLQRKYSLGSFNLLGHTAPAQAASLLVLGPFVDFWLTNKRVDTFNYTSIVTVCDAYSESVLLMSLQNCFKRNLFHPASSALYILLLVCVCVLGPLTWSRNTSLSISSILYTYKTGFSSLYH